MDKLPIPPDTRILIVEDNDLVRETLRTAFIGTRDVWTASNIKEGWELYKQYTPHVVFMDIGLPDGNGHELAKMIKDTHQNTYVVMISSSTKIQDKMDAAHNSVNGYITKPLTRLTIKQSVDRYLEDRRTRRARNI